MARKRGIRPKKQEEGGAAEWMNTYGDMVTLLLTFFIMLFSMATLDKAKYEALADALRGQFSSFSVDDLPPGDSDGNSDIEGLEAGIQQLLENSAKPPTPTQTNAAGEPVVNEYETFLQKIRDLIFEHDLGEYVSVFDDGTTITLRVNSIILFDSGSATIKPVGWDVLKNTGEVLRELDRYIIVQGHTDNVPISNTLFPSNWELSTKRATNVVQYLIDEASMDPKKLSAAGYGEHQPISSNDTVEDRAENRRIDIVIIK